MLCNCCKKQITDGEDLEYCEVCTTVYCNGCTRLRMKDIGESVFVCNDCHKHFDDHIGYIQKYGLKRYRKVLQGKKYKK